MFITFEGIEGCGKTTQIKRLSGVLTRSGVPHITTLEPGGTLVGVQIRRILLDAGNTGLSPMAELMLYEADRAQHVEEIIRPALEHGKWVLCDRFFDATMAYQGVARDLDRPFVESLNERVTSGIRPDRTFLLDCPVEVGLDRALKRNQKDSEKGQDRFERERLTFHRKVREAYLEFARRDADRFVVVDGVLSEDEVEERIIEHVLRLLPGESPMGCLP